MTALDASSVIAFLDPADAHHHDATQALRRLLMSDARLTIGPITMAEVLVGPTRRGEASTVHTGLARIGIEILSLPPNAPTTLAALRVMTGLRMPDCCVVLTATQDDQSMLTFDERLAKGAISQGLRTLGTLTS